MNNIVYIFTAIAGFSLQSFGGVMQKKGLVWTDLKKKKEKKYISALVIWVLGIVLFNVSVIPIGIASKGLPPHIVSGASGFGITVVVFSSYFLLKEKIFISDVVYSILIISSIFLFSIIQKPFEDSVIKIQSLIILTILPVVFLIPVLINTVPNKIKAIHLSTFSGLFGGLAVVLINVTVKVSGQSILEYFKVPYLYLYIVVGLFAFLAIQFAYKYGDFIVVAPIQISFSIIYPVICSYFVFNAYISFIQVAITIVILYSCISILRKR